MNVLAIVVVAGTVLSLTGAGQPADAEERAAPSRNPAMTLWYDEPATDWESRSLPIGNGALGASVFGGVRSEQLQFNEKTLWTGGPGSPGYDFGNWHPPRPNAISDVRQRIDAEQQVTPEWVAGVLGQPKTGFGAYQTFGDVRLTQSQDPPAVTNYRRHLDIADAVAGVTYDSAGVTFTPGVLRVRDRRRARRAGDREPARPDRVHHGDHRTGQPVEEHDRAGRPDHLRRQPERQRDALRGAGAGAQ